MRPSEQGAAGCRSRLASCHATVAAECCRLTHHSAENGMWPERITYADKVKEKHTKVNKQIPPVSLGRATRAAAPGEGGRAEPEATRGWARGWAGLCSVLGAGWCRAFQLPPAKPTLTQTESPLQTLLFWEPPPRVLGLVLGTKMQQVQMQAGPPACLETRELSPPDAQGPGTGGSVTQPMP